MTQTIQNSELTNANATSATRQTAQTGLEAGLTVVIGYAHLLGASDITNRLLAIKNEVIEGREDHRPLRQVMHGTR